MHNCQHVRSAGSKQSRYGYRLGREIPVRIGLSGTPFPETPLDAYGVYRFLDPSIFGTRFDAFTQRYAITDIFHRPRAYINQDELKEKIDSLRLTISPEGYELPEFQHIVVTVALPEKVQRFYKTLEQDLYGKIENGEVTVANAAVLFTKLQCVCSGFILLDREESHDAQHKGTQHALSFLRQAVGATASCVHADVDDATLSGWQEGARSGASGSDDGGEHGSSRGDGRRLQTLHTVKADALRDILLSVPLTESVVVYARFHVDLAKIHEVAHECGRQSVEISGRPGRPQAQLQGGKWVEGPETVMVVQGATGVEGIDLTRASKAVYYSYVLELGKYLQSCARIRRPGQVQRCVYYHIVCTGTVDSKIRRLLANKRSVLDGLLQEHEE